MTLPGIYKINQRHGWSRRDGGGEGGASLFEEQLALCPQGECEVALRAGRPEVGFPPKGVFTTMLRSGCAFEGSVSNAPLIKAVMAGRLQG